MLFPGIRNGNRLWLMLIIPAVLASGGFSQTRKQTLSAPLDVAVPDTINNQRQTILINLEAQCESVKGWKNNASAAKFLARVAELIYESKNDAARQYLEKAWEAALKVKDEGQGTSKYRNESKRNAAAQEVIGVARKLFPDLSEKWLDDLVEIKQGDQRQMQGGIFDDRSARSNVLLQLAFEAASTNPEMAADLATDSLRDGISFGLQNVLIAVQEKRPELAQRVFEVALDRLRSRGTFDAGELLILYSYLFTPGRILAPNTTENRTSFQVALSRNQFQIRSAAETNPQLARRFVQIASALLINMPLPSEQTDLIRYAREQYAAINLILGKAELYAADLIPALSQKQNLLISQAQFTNQPAITSSGIITPESGESGKEYRGRIIDEMVKRAEKESTSLGRDIMLARAAIRTEVTDYERGLAITRKIEDKELEKNISDLIRYRAALHFFQNQEMQEAYRLLAKIENPLQHASALIFAGRSAAEKKNFSQAESWLSEAFQQIKAANPLNKEWGQVALGLVAAWSKFNEPVALEKLSYITRHLKSDMVSYSEDSRPPLAIRVSGLDFPDFTYSYHDFGWQAGVTGFSDERFDQVLEVLRNLDDPETRGMAILTLCQHQMSRLRKQGYHGSASKP